MHDLGVSRKLNIQTDASVAQSIASRRGAGKVQHIEVNQLWLQERVFSGEIIIENIKGTDNVADLLTKFKFHEDIQNHLKWTNIKVSGDRN